MSILQDAGGLGSGRERSFQHGALVGIATAVASHVDPRGNVLLDVELCLPTPFNQAVSRLVFE